MRLSSVVILGLAALVVTGCDNDSVTGVRRPPTAEVRFMNAVNEGWFVDIRNINQVDWVPVGNELPYRGATVYYPTEAGKALTFRVFPTSINHDETSRVLHEATFTFQEGQRVTLVLTGSVNGPMQFLTIDDDKTAPPAGQIGVRFVNMTGAAANGYLVTATGDAQPGTPHWANVPARSAAANYVNRAAGAAAVQATGVASVAAAGPAAPTNPAGEPLNPAVGVNSPGTKFSVYYFPAVTAVASAAGRPAVAATAASLVWYWDRNPADL